MAKFEKGDRVLVNGSMVATIHTYDEATGRLVLDAGSPERGPHLIYGPISAYRVQRLVAEAVAEDPEPDTEEDEAEEEGPRDEFTTSESFA